MRDVRELANEPVPLHLRNAVTGMMKDMGYGKDYKYSHDFQGHFADQEYLPPSLKGRQYYRPSEEGAEQEIGRRLKRWWSGRPDGNRSQDHEGESPASSGPDG